MTDKNPKYPKGIVCLDVILHRTHYCFHQVWFMFQKSTTVPLFQIQVEQSISLAQFKFKVYRAISLE